MAVRIRGIYASALTALCSDVVQPSPAIAERVDETLQSGPAAARIRTTPDRRGVGIHGDPDRVADLLETLTDVGRDAVSWTGALPAGGLYAGRVSETRRRGALVDVGDGTGWLPGSATERRLEEGDALRVRVADPMPPWVDERPVLETGVRVEGGLVSLVRGGGSSAGHPELVDVLSTDPPEGWWPTWADGATDESLETLDDALGAVVETAKAIDAALADGDAPMAAAAGPYWTGNTTAWVWFGRESRFDLDDHRRELVTTMPGHHRIKAGTPAAGAAVDFVESVCEGEAVEADFPVAATLRQFGPAVGDTVAIGHGKPGGHLVDLGPATVTARDLGGRLTVEREMQSAGVYDGLAVERQPGDVAETVFKEGRWWYPTVYTGADGERRGTYVNVCTPVELFPDTVRYLDLHVDVVKHREGTVETLDDDELGAAVDAGHVQPALATKARAVAADLTTALAAD